MVHVCAYCIVHVNACVYMWCNVKEKHNNIRTSFNHFAASHLAGSFLNLMHIILTFCVKLYLLHAAFFISLQLEKKKRRNAEKRLRLAEDSLKRLDKALRESGVKIDLEIETDVKNLRGRAQQENVYMRWDAGVIESLCVAVL